MRILEALCARHPNAVNDARMIEFIRKHQIIPANERFKHPEISGIPGTKVESCLCSLKSRKAFFNRCEFLRISTNQPRPCRSACGGGDSFGHFRFDKQMS